MIRIILLISLFTINFAYSKTKSECLSSIDEIIQGDEVKQEKLSDFLKIQAGLTLHRLAYATFRKGISKERFKIEDEIFNILDSLEEKKKDPEFMKVYNLYRNSSNKLSRTALAQVLPYIKNILNDQNNEEDPYKRQMFNLGMSDIKMLSLLSQKEAKYSNGNFKHLLSANRESDSSILNFTKIINSSIRNTSDDVEDIRKTMERRLKVLQEEANDILNDLFLGTECEVVLQACKAPEGDNNPIIDEQLFTSLTLAVNKLDSKDKFDNLRYDDVWLYTKGSVSNSTKTNSNINKSKIQVENKRVSIIVEKTDEQVINDYLVQHVLDHLPYFFERKDLEQDPELTLALARAIDRDALGSSDFDKRVFHYKGKSYHIPETWNSSYGAGRVKSGLMGIYHKAKNFWDLTDDKINYPEGLNEEHKEAFLELRNEQKYIHKNKYTFSYKGKLYLLNGDLVKPEKNSILQFPVGESKIKEQLVLTDKQKTKIATELKDENLSYISEEGGVKHISGVEVDLKNAHKKAKIRFNRSNMNISGHEDSEYPALTEIEQLIEKTPNQKNQIIKAIADRNRVVHTKDFTYDLVLKKEVSTDDAKQTIIEHRLGYGVIRNPAELSFRDDYLKSNAASIINNKPTFRVENTTYLTSTGYKKKLSKENSLVKGMSSHEELHEDIVQMNEKTQKSRIAQYHQRYKIDGCEHISLVDKIEGRLSVIDSNGDIVFEKEVLSGKEIGDKRTKYFGNFEDRKSNNSTGAGKYQLGKTKSESISDYHNNFEGNFLTLNRKGENGDIQTITAIHQVSKNALEQNTLFNNNDSSDNRATSGGISMRKLDMQNYMNKYYKSGCPLFVLAESDKVKFKVVGEQLVLQNQTNELSSDYYIDTIEQEKPKNIKIAMTDKRYINEFTSDYILTLQEEKDELMKSAGLTNDEYNEIAKVAFGVLGTESDFATNNLYKFKETIVGQVGVDVAKGNFIPVPSVITGTSVLSVPTSVVVESPQNSRGPTQIKQVQTYLPKRYKNLKSFDLNRPDHAAVATLMVLANKYKSFKNLEKSNSAISDRNRMEFLYYLYMGSADQIINQSSTVGLNPKADEVRQYANSLNILQEY